MKFVDDLTDEVEEEIKETVVDELDVRDMWDDTDSLWTFFLIFRWLLNLVFIATPWIFFSQIFFAWNVLFNAKWNFLWAGGNVYLIANTIYAYIFTWLSVFVVMEMPIYMKHMKIVRGTAWFMAIIYNILYMISFGDFLLLLFYYDKETFDILYLLEAMFFGYNIILHCPITVVNNVLILKEIGLEFFQASATRHGHNTNIALGLKDGWDFMLTTLAIVNPMTYLKFARNELYDKLYRKYITNEPVIKHHTY